MSNTVSSERLAELQKDCGTPNPPTQETYWFRKALAGEGPHAYDWLDKPHRLVFDLCRLIESDAALLRSKPAAGVEVKPLDWRIITNKDWGEHAGGFEGSGALGSKYRVWLNKSLSNWNVEHRLDGHITELDYYETKEQAKAAAEADYRQRILSTLSLPAQEPVATFGDSGPTPGQSFGDEFDPSPQPEAVITEEMVERAAKKFVAHQHGQNLDEFGDGSYARGIKHSMRLALTAALVKP